jgi:hypothetical protein
MSKATQARPPRLSARNGGQGFSLRRTDRTPQTAFSQTAGANPRRTPLTGREALLSNKRAIYGWILTGIALYPS